MPDEFTRRWLAFDPQQPTRRRLARRFLGALLAMLAFSGMLALLAAR